MIPAAGTRVRLYTRVPFEIYLDSLVEVLHDDDDMGRRSAVCTGALCETALDPCAGVFCGEHGTCRATKIGQYVGLGLGLLRVRWRLERPAVPRATPSAAQMGDDALVDTAWWARVGVDVGVPDLGHWGNSRTKFPRREGLMNRIVYGRRGCCYYLLFIIISC